MTDEIKHNGSIENHKPLNQSLVFWLILLLSFSILVIKKMVETERGHKPPPTLVVIAPVQTKVVPIYLNALGSVTPTYSVTVRTQLSGLLMRVTFQEGQLVKAGDLLAEIDPRPYLAQLQQYEGQLERDRAQLSNALIDLTRYQTLWRQNSLAQQTLATQQALVKQLQGSIQLDEGLIQGTKLNLYYTKITAPIDGRIGLRLIDPGNYIQNTNTTGIAVVNTVNPITIIFSLPQDDISDVLTAMRANKEVTVLAYDRMQQNMLAQGKLLTIDNQIDVTTGTVKLKAQFNNENNSLFPNQFVNIKLLVNTLQHALVIPTAGVQEGENKTFVYRLNTNHTVSVVPIKTNVTVGEFTVIDQGLARGQQVVVEGVDKLSDGAKVTVAHPQPKVKHWL